MLSHRRVLDLTNEREFIAGKLLENLVADGLVWTLLPIIDNLTD
jgi:hypothetical protein